MQDKTDLSGGGYNGDNAISIGGNFFDIGTRVVKWWEGFNGYDQNRVVIEREDRRTGKIKKRVIRGKRYSKRALVGSGLAGVRQFVIHHTGGPLARRAFNTLHNNRKLSVHFILADDGTIYQTVDGALCTWHAGKRHNKISLGVECCLYPDAERNPEYYSPARCKRIGMAPHETMEDRIHGVRWEVFAFTDAQIAALAKLVAGSWVALKRSGVKLPDGPPTFPRDSQGEITKTVADDPVSWIGMIGHLQITRKKVDPAGFPWASFEQAVAQEFARFGEQTA